MLRALITEEPDDRIGHVRICGGDGRVIGCLYPEVWSEHSSREDAFDFVREAGLRDRGHPWGQHIRFSRIYPLLDEVTARILGHLAQDSGQAGQEDHRGHAGLVPAQPTPPGGGAVSDTML